MAGLKKEVVGRNKTTLPTPTPTPSATQKDNPKAFGSPVSSNITNRLDALLSNSGISLGSFIASSASVGLIGDLSDAELRSIGTLLKKIGYSVKSLEEARTLLLSSDFPDADTRPDYNSLVSYIRSQTIPKTTGNKIPTQTVTQYNDNQLKEIGNAVAQDFLGRNLEATEIETILPKLKKIVEAGTTTTSKVVGGKNVVTVTPGFSKDRAQAVVQAELKKSAADDLQVKQYADFTDWLSKNMAGM